MRVVGRPEIKEKHKSEAKEIKELKVKVETLEKEIETERTAKEEALVKVETLEKEVLELKEASNKKKKETE